MGGTVTWSKMMPSKGKPSQAAIVEFADIAEAKWVVENVNGNVPQGLSTPITVAFKRETKVMGRVSVSMARWVARRVSMRVGRVSLRMVVEKTVVAKECAGTSKISANASMAIVANFRINNLLMNTVKSHT